MNIPPIPPLLKSIGCGETAILYLGKIKPIAILEKEESDNNER
jgi:hypothetical protein